MTALLKDLGLYLWRLLPANPILVRVVQGGGRRRRDFFVRLAYLAILLGVTLLGTVQARTDQATSLADQAKASADTFVLVSYAQLAMMCLIAPMYTAGAITQERDNETYNILLTTPLGNAQIVIGSLFSRLYFILMLLLAGLPIYSLTLLYGGVSLAQILLTGVISACTALLFGSFAISVAVMGVGTRRTIFTFYMLIAMYLLSVWALAPYTPAPGAVAAPGSAAPMSWLAAFHPFLALNVVLGQTPAPPEAAVRELGWPWPHLLAYPAEGFMVLTVLVSAAVIVACIGFVRRQALEGEMTPLRRVLDVVLFWRRKRLGRQPRVVWDNPVAWVEARTRASLGGTGVMRGILVLGGAAAAVAILLLLLRGQGAAATAASVRTLLVEVIVIEFGLILLMAANVAAGAITREYESKSLNTLICTPLTPRYIIGGKIRGLVFFAVPLVLVPVGTVLLFVVVGLIWPAYATVPWESFFLVGLVMAAFAALACNLGMYISLNNTKTVVAVMKAVAVLVVVHGVLYGCGSKMSEANSPTTGAFAAQFSPFSAVVTLLDPQSLLTPGGRAASLGEIRVAQTIAALLVVGAAALITLQMYRGMARAFDTIIRTKISEAG